MRGLQAAFIAILLIFLGTRIALHFGLTPFFDRDTYKYIGGADALWAGQDLPPLFRDLDVTGGALHAVPAYAWFIEWIWTLAGGITLRGVLIAQSFLSLIGYLAAADLVRRWVGPRTALAVLAALSLAPPLGWLEHLVLSDVLAPPLFFGAAWLVVTAPLGSRLRWRAGLNGVVCGLILGFEVLLRTASQIYMPILPILAWTTRNSLSSFTCWGIGLASGIALSFLPWVLQNHAQHGVYAVSASTGRNLYFSALWSNTIDRAQQAREFGLPVSPSPQSSFDISDAALRRLLAEGHSFAEADAEMGRMTLRAYSAKPFASIAEERFDLVMGLFQSSRESGVFLIPLRPNPNAVLSNPRYQVAVRKGAEARFKHVLSQPVVDEMERLRRDPGLTGEFFKIWVRALTLEGLPLLALFLFSLPALLLLPHNRFSVFLTFATLPLEFLTVFLMVGTPAYRYQAALHPFLLTTMIVGSSAGLQRIAVSIRSRRSLQANRISDGVYGSAAGS